jgi:uncharacterized protein
LIDPGAGSGAESAVGLAPPQSRYFNPVHDFLIALALLLVMEGVWPFLNPPSFRRTLLTVAGEPDGRLRMTGLISMVAGVGLLYLVN